MTTLKKELPVDQRFLKPYQAVLTRKALQAQSNILSHHFHESLVFASVSFLMFLSLLRDASQQNKNQACCFFSQNNQWIIQPETCHYTLMTSLVGVRLVLLAYQLIQAKLEQRKQKTLLFKEFHARVNGGSNIDLTASNASHTIPETVIDPAAPENTLQLPTRSYAP